MNLSRRTKASGRPEQPIETEGPVVEFARALRQPRLPDREIVSLVDWFQLRRLGRQYVAAIRLITLAPTVIVAMVVGREAPRPEFVVAILAIVLAWSMGYVLALRREPPVWITLVDAAVLAVLALSTLWIVPVSWLISGKSWLLPFASFACVGYQYYAGWLLGGTAALVVASGNVVGVLMALPEGQTSASLLTAGWTFVVALLARGLWTLARSGGSDADKALAKTLRARQDQVSAEARRTAEVEYNRLLHDTAAATLLMVGLGQVRRGSELLVTAARRDLATLNQQGDQLPERSDLMLLLGEVVEIVIRPTVDFCGVPSLILPTEVAYAIKGAVGEALNNVANHAGVDSCTVRVDGNSHQVCVEIVDDGVGFDPTRVPVLNRGLRDSIQARMVQTGGNAAVETSPGCGTTVRLVWPA